MQQSIRFIGHALIDVQDELFMQGFLEAFEFYRGLYVGKIISADTLYNIFMRALDVKNHSRWNAGFFTGFISAMHMQSDDLPVFESYTISVEVEDGKK